MIEGGTRLANEVKERGLAPEGGMEAHHVR